MHTIDTKYWQVRTDLIMDSALKDYPGAEHVEIDKIQIDRMNLKEELFHKKKGNYVTLSFEDVSDKDNFKKVEQVLIEELKRVIKNFALKMDDTVLVVGLGKVFERIGVWGKENFL